MKKKYFCIAAIWLLVCFSIAAGEYNYSTLNFPDSLKENAYAIVRFDHIVYEYKNPESAVKKIKKAITILDDKGIKAADFYEGGSKYIKLKSFKGIMYNAKGEKIKTFNKQEIHTSAFSPHLATDNFIYYFTCDPPTVPFTISYEYEMEYTDGIIFFPYFNPQYTYNISVQEASYCLQHPLTTPILLKVLRINSVPETQTSKDIKTTTWSVKNLRAKENEKFAPDLENYVPQIYAAPEKFIYAKSSGSIANAETIAEWQKQLNLNRNNLSEELKKKITDLTKDVPDIKEKVRILYNFLGNTTRYESIQLGIGGFQPIPADEVCRTGFGDCKGLSNYLKAMLNHIGIPANYTIIRMDRNEKKLSNDFTAFMNTNHIILQVPLPGDTLWLECTNTKVPFGYVHNGIAGHHAIVSTDEGGIMTILPDYPDTMNIERNHLTVEVDSEGKAIVKATKTWDVKEYDNNSHLITAKASDQIDFLRKKISLPQVTIGTIQLTETKSEYPSMSMKYDWQTTSYGSKTGNRLFIPVNTLKNNIKHGFVKSHRTNDIQIINGGCDIDSISITIPEGYVIESIPVSIAFDSQFGGFRSEIVTNENKILIHQLFSLKSGYWDVSTYPDLFNFFEQTAIEYNRKIILRKIL